MLMMLILHADIEIRIDTELEVMPCRGEAVSALKILLVWVIYTNHYQVIIP